MTKSQDIYDEFISYLEYVNKYVPNIIKSGVSGINYEIYNYFLNQQRYIAKKLSEMYKEKKQYITQSICVCYDRPKTHALFFDRIDFLPLPKCIDGNIIFPKDIESMPDECINYLQTKHSLITNFIGEFAQAMPMFNPYDEDDIKDFLEFLAFLKGQAIEHDLVGEIQDCVHNIIPNGAIKKEFEGLSSTYSNTSITPAYETKDDFDNEFEVGDYRVVIASLDNLNLVKENELEWRQVLDFRSDRECRENYKKFLNFVKFSKGISDFDSITYSIEKSYFAYEQALKKHGIKTAIGCISDVINAKSITSTALLAIITNCINSALTPLSVAIGSGINLIIQIVHKAIEYQKLTPDDSIAWIYNLKNKIN